MSAGQRRREEWRLENGARTFCAQTLDQLAQDAALDALGVRERDQDIDVVRLHFPAAVAVAPRQVRSPEPGSREGGREVEKSWNSELEREDVPSAEERERSALDLVELEFDKPESRILAPKSEQEGHRNKDGGKKEKRSTRECSRLRCAGSWQPNPQSVHEVPIDADREDRTSRSGRRGTCGTVLVRAVSGAARLAAECGLCSLRTASPPSWIL